MIMTKDIKNELDELEKYVKDSLLILSDLYHDIEDLRGSTEDAEVMNAGYLRPDCAIRLETVFKETINDRVELAESYNVKLDPREKEIWSDILKRFE